MTQSFNGDIKKHVSFWTLLQWFVPYRSAGTSPFFSSNRGMPCHGTKNAKGCSMSLGPFWSEQTSACLANRTLNIDPFGREQVSLPTMPILHPPWEEHVRVIILINFAWVNAKVKLEPCKLPDILEHWLMQFCMQLPSQSMRLTSDVASMSVPWTGHNPVLMGQPRPPWDLPNHLNVPNARKTPDPNHGDVRRHLESSNLTRLLALILLQWKILIPASNVWT